MSETQIQPQPTEETPPPASWWEVIPTPPDAGPAPVIEGIVGDVRGYGGIRGVGPIPEELRGPRVNS